LGSYSTAASYNAAFLVGIESEFILLKNTNPIETVNAHGWSNSQALASGTKETEAMEDIAQGLIKSGIELMMYHSEGAPGQVGGFNLTRCVLTLQQV
jgi:glutamine synthetase